MHATKFSNPKVDSYNLSEASHALWNEVTCFAHGKRDPCTLQAAMEAPPARSLRTLRLPLCLVAWGLLHARLLDYGKKLQSCCASICFATYEMRCVDITCLALYSSHSWFARCGFIPSWRPLEAASYICGSNVQLLPAIFGGFAGNCRTGFSLSFMPLLPVLRASCVSLLALHGTTPCVCTERFCSPLLCHQALLDRPQIIFFWLGMWVMPLSLTESTPTRIYMKMPRGMI